MSTQPFLRRRDRARCLKREFLKLAVSSRTIDKYGGFETKLVVVAGRFERVRETEDHT